MPLWAYLGLLALFAGVALVSIYLGWRHRVARTEPLLAALPAMPDDDELGAPLTAELSATYVSTTSSGDWLDRVAAGDLGVRSVASVRVFPAGVRVLRTGARDVFIGARDLLAVRAPDRPGADQIVLTWEVGPGFPLDTALRVRRRADRAALASAVIDLRAAAPKETS